MQVARLPDKGSHTQLKKKKKKSKETSQLFTDINYTSKILPQKPNIAGLTWRVICIKDEVTWLSNPEVCLPVLKVQSSGNADSDLHTIL